MTKITFPPMMPQRFKTAFETLVLFVETLGFVFDPKDMGGVKLSNGSISIDLNKMASNKTMDLNISTNFTARVSFGNKGFCIAIDECHIFEECDQSIVDFGEIIGKVTTRLFERKQ